MKNRNNFNKLELRLIFIKLSNKFVDLPTCWKDYCPKNFSEISKKYNSFRKKFFKTCKKLAKLYKKLSIIEKKFWKFSKKTKDGKLKFDFNFYKFLLKNKSFFNQKNVY